MQTVWQVQALTITSRDTPLFGCFPDKKPCKESFQINRTLTKKGLNASFEKSAQYDMSRNFLPFSAYERNILTLDSISR